ncbi:TPA: dipeptide ABC transporter ATP-binding protein [Candidatus Gastranaerophilales bacterium HUM_6]|nr:oligopeptide/dipeptide ABC transporter ATPase subunit [Fusobacterium sp. CAG:815]DAA93365.1 MAG TPA: dipeptide ABC transporter ATP-binding protein [Candidatus Gastranaerophilales bacterium HUM_6]DAA96144.1 MAG TPA: dipeptide ABC transporter ATP-binding protein [Candidatus Gastranaerophilales bacterium HUM_7]DAB03106.1 MAG TPA: dipeptide ABC transporter ATP-binding protein [Candidatus Gastranaerophilales bacterium HUM_12]DAB08056.1 MAG TPA: dipeptide ABC transporter ATP-binding protein [Candi
MNLLEIKNLNVTYQTKKGLIGKIQTVHAVNNVSLDIQKGEILAIAGESGCGKSTLAKAIMKLVQSDSGEILLNGENVLNLKHNKDLKKFYQKVQMIFQNPYSSLNPKMKIGEILKEPLIINTDLKKEEITKIVEEKIKKVGLDKSALNLYPHEFSGGQRQRIAIARSLILNPEFIIADEPVSALDVSIQAQIINLLKQLKEDFNLTFLFISHDLSVIKYLSDRIAIMYLGEVVEIGRTEEIFKNPKHPYTKALLSSVPELNPQDEKERIHLQGELPSPENLPTGCKFHTRCPYVMEICKTSTPQVKEFSDTHNCKCFLYN